VPMHPRRLERTSTATKPAPCAAQACLLAVPARLDAAMAVRVLCSARHRTAPSASQSGASY
jgi:hypothetical protein